MWRGLVVKKSFLIKTFFWYKKVFLVTTVVGRLCDFLWEEVGWFVVWRGCVIFVWRSVLVNLFFWRLRDFFCGEVARFFCWEIAWFFVWKGYVIFCVKRLRNFLCVKRYSSEKKFSDENVFWYFLFFYFVTTVTTVTTVPTVTTAQCVF